MKRLGSLSMIALVVTCLACLACLASSGCKKTSEGANELMAEMEGDWVLGDTGTEMTITPDTVTFKVNGKEYTTDYRVVHERIDDGWLSLRFGQSFNDDNVKMVGGSNEVGFTYNEAGDTIKLSSITLGNKSLPEFKRK